jgi:hypothetical protein
VGAAAALRERFGGGGGVGGGRGRRPSRGGDGGGGRRGGHWGPVGELGCGGGRRAAVWKRESREENEPRGMSAGLHKTVIPVGQSKGRRELTNSRRPTSGPTGVNLSPSDCVRADGS